MYIPTGGVAVFDSGIGGLTVLAECKKRLPFQVFYYYGDNARAPYGNLPVALVRQYVLECFEYIARLQPSAAVIACNTVTALCIDELRKKYPFPIVGAEPAVFSAAKKGGDVFVLATRATCNSVRFQSLCERAAEKYAQVSFRVFPCENLAGEVEQHLLDKHFDFTPLLPKGNPDSVVLGCTHYVFIKDTIKQFYRCPTFDGNVGMANRLCNFVDNLPNPLYGLNCGEVLSTTQNQSKKRAVQPLLSTPTFAPPIYFLGAQKVRNQRVFEQTFAFSGNKRGSGG